MISISPNSWCKTIWNIHLLYVPFFGSGPMYTGLSCLSFAWMTVKSVLYLFELAKLSNSCSFRLSICFIFVSFWISKALKLTNLSRTNVLVLYLFELAKLSNHRSWMVLSQLVLYLFELAKLSNFTFASIPFSMFCIFLN